MTTFGGKAIEYDVIGNPTKYDGWSFFWQAGRQLKEMTKDSRYARFAYDHDGMRTRKQTESGRTDYYWSGKRLLELKVGDDVLHMYYDAAGKPAAVSYGNNRYRYVYNLQGDVIALIDAEQTAVVEYRYDAWGKLLATTGSMANTLGKLNPFRYRGYIYDEETGLYWLRSRYYNPEWKRFLNADNLLGKCGELISHNLFVYCGNNPLMQIDPSGNVPVALQLYTFAIGATSNKHYNFSNTPISAQLTRQFRRSLVMSDRIMQYIRAIPEGENSYTNTEAIYFSPSEAIDSRSLSDLDLAMAIGHASDFTITVEKMDKGVLESILFRSDKYKVTYTLADIYDFANWEDSKKSAILIWINNTLGYYPQEAGVLHIYDYTISDSFIVYPR